MIDPAPPYSPISSTGQPEITILQGGLAMRPPGPQLGTHITRENYFVLMEGAGTSKEASIRDVSLGVGFTALTTAASLFFSCDLTRTINTNPGVIKVPIWGPLLTLIFMLFIGLFSIILAYISNIRAKGDTGRMSYKLLLERLRSDLGIQPDPIPASRNWWHFGFSRSA
jgi:hypothetical protein